MSVDLAVNGERYGYYRADAVVVATPAGSTAHARRNRVVLSLLDLPLRPDQLLELVPAELRAGRAAAAGASDLQAP